MKNIFLVKSPLQLLNAIEAKHFFALADDDCALVVMGDRKSYTQLMRLVWASDQWKQVVLINRVGLFSGDPWSQEIDFDKLEQHRRSLLRGSFFSIRRLNRLAATAAEVNRIFIGDNNNVLMRHFVNMARHRDTVLLDDGTATLDIARQRCEGATFSGSQKTSKKIKLAAKRLLQGLRDRQPKEVVFFSTYAIEVKSPDQLVPNRFGYLRGRIEHLDESGEIYFLGSPLSEVGLMEETDYIDQLAMAKSQFPEKLFVYIAHRRERPEKLQAIRQRLNIETRLFDFPIEYQLAMIGPRPEAVVSFITSALDNLNHIMGECMEIIAFRLLKGSYRNQARIDAIYDHYVANGNAFFKVRNLPE